MLYELGELTVESYSNPDSWMNRVKIPSVRKMRADLFFYCANVDSS